MLKQSKTIWILAAVITALAGLGLWWLTGESKRSGGGSGPTATLWPVGAQYELDFVWTGRAAGSLAETSLEASVQWVGRASAASVETAGGAHAVIVSDLELDPEQSSQRVLTSEMAGADLSRLMADQTVVLWLDDEGGLAELTFSSPELANTPLLDFATTLGCALRDEATWTSTEVTPDGRAETAGHRSKHAFELERTSLTELRIAPFLDEPVKPALSKEQVELQADGWRYSGIMQFEVSRDLAQFRVGRSWEIVARPGTSAPVDVPSGGERKSLAAWQAPTPVEKTRGRPSELSREAVLAYVDNYAARIEGTGFSAEFQQALRKVAEDPELQQQLAGRYLELSPSSRMGVIDLLAQCGSPSALEALADVMDTMLAHGDLPQSLDAIRGALFVDEPSGPFLERLMRIQAHDSTHVQRVAAFGLGSTIYQCKSAGDCGGTESAAFEHLMTWAEKEMATGSEEAKRYALDALGNAGGEAIVPAVQPALDDPSQLVRRAATLALRRVGNEASRDLIVARAGDTSASVQHAAFSVLERDPDLDPETVHALQSRIEGAPLHPQVAPSAVAILARTKPPGWERSLQHIIDSTSIDSATRGRAKRLLRDARARSEGP